MGLASLWDLPTVDPPSSRVVVDQDLQKGQSGESQGSAVKVLVSAPSLPPCGPPPPEAEPQPFPGLGLVSCCLGASLRPHVGEATDLRTRSWGWGRPVVGPLAGMLARGGAGVGGMPPGRSPGLGPEADLCVGCRASPLSGQRGEARPQ